MRLCLIGILYTRLVSAIVADESVDESLVIKKIELLGGTIIRADDLPGSPVVGIEFHGNKRFNEKHLHLLRQFRSLKSVDLGDIELSEAGLNDIAELRQSSMRVTAYYDNPQEVAAIDFIKGLGAKIKKDGSLPGCPVVEVDLGLIGVSQDEKTIEKLRCFTGLRKLYLSNTVTDGTGLSALRELDEFAVLDLSNTVVSDASVMELRELKHLTTLRINTTRITDASMKNIGKMSSLRILMLDYTQITDAELKWLKELKQLSSLGLAGNAITDEGLKELGELAQLKALSLNNTRVTDAGLKSLTKLQHLAGIGLGGTQVSAGGVAELIQSLPNLRVER